MRQFVVTPAMGKRLIGKGMATHPAIRAVLRKGTLAIVAGTTNGYVAEEILSATGQGEGFSRRGFRRGMVTAPGFDVSAVAAPFPGDVVLVDGAWRKGLSIADVAAGLGAGDVVLKGGNAEDAEGRLPVCSVLDRDQSLSIAADKNGAVGAWETAVHCERLI